MEPGTQRAKHKFVNKPKLLFVSMQNVMADVSSRTVTIIEISLILKSI